VNIKALDANNQPVQTEGTVKVTRDYGYEIWLDPSGKEIKGDALQTLRDKGRIFPPPPKDPKDKPWQLKFRGYQHDEILTRTVKTNAEGEAELTFTPEREGYYRVAWSSPDLVAQASLPVLSCGCHQAYLLSLRQGTGALHRRAIFRRRDGR
jgi:hypothetical protein